LNDNDFWLIHCFAITSTCLQVNCWEEEKRERMRSYQQKTDGCFIWIHFEIPKTIQNNNEPESRHPNIDVGIFLLLMKVIKLSWIFALNIRCFRTKLFVSSNKLNKVCSSYCKIFTARWTCDAEWKLFWYKSNGIFTLFNRNRWLVCKENIFEPAIKVMLGQISTHKTVRISYNYVNF
jgi:hypothetical protein